jgi:hypothetical protein
MVAGAVVSLFGSNEITYHNLYLDTSIFSPPAASTTIGRQELEICEEGLLHHALKIGLHCYGHDIYIFICTAKVRKTFSKQKAREEFQ